MQRSVRSKLRLKLNRPFLTVTAACGLLAALAAGRVLANDCMGPNFGALRFNFTGIFLEALLIWLLYVGAVCLVEAGILKLFFKIGYVRCLGYAAVANFVSAGIGFLWMLYPGGIWNPREGWRAAILEHETGRLTILLVRSFLVTVAEETVVIVLMARKVADMRTVFKAVAVANIVSYAASAALMAAIR